MPILTSLTPHGLPGQVADTAPTLIETYRLATTARPAIYELNLNPIAGSIQNLGQYTINIDGQPITLTFRDGGGSLVQNLAAQLSSLVSQYGYYWAVIVSSGLIRLTARTPGVTQPITLGTGLTGSTLTLTQSATVTEPPVPGSLLYFLAGNDGQDYAATYDLASTSPGFDASRDIAGVLVRTYDNYKTLDSSQGDVVQILRQGHIWVKNYGTSQITRQTTPLSNRLAGTPTLPCGVFGVGDSTHSASLSWSNFMYARPANPGELTLLRVHLN